MRATFAMVNRNVQQNLGMNYSKMVQLQEQLATGKRLRKPSDDPVDVANDLKLRTKQTELLQYKRNIQDGLAVMGVASSAMQSMNELLHRMRELAVQAANDTNTASDRQYIQQEVDQLFRQMMSVINTQFKGDYVFNGTQTKIPPYEILSSGDNLNNYADRTMAAYGGDYMRDSSIDNDPGDYLYLDYDPMLKVGDRIQMKWSSAVNPDLDNTNAGLIIPETMPLDTLSVGGMTFNQMKKGLTPDDPGYVTPDYTVDYRTGEIIILSEEFRAALNNTVSSPIATRVISAPAQSASETFTLDFATDPTYTIKDLPTLPDVLDESSIVVAVRDPSDPDNDIILEENVDYTIDISTGMITMLNDDHDGSDISVEFDYATNIDPFRYSVQDKVQIYDVKYDSVTPVIKNIFPGSLQIKIGDEIYREGIGEYEPHYYDEDGVFHEGNVFDYKVDYITGEITIYNMDLMRDMRPPSLSGNTGEEDLYRAGGFSLIFDYIAQGENVYGDKVASHGKIYRAIEEGISPHINIGVDELLRDKWTGNDMMGVLMRYSQALHTDDRDTIQKSIDELSTMYDAVLNAQSQLGARIYRFELTLSRNEEQYVEVSIQQSTLEDADLAETISRLASAQTVYQAALQSSMRVLQLSLANYM